MRGPTKTRPSLVEQAKDRRAERVVRRLAERGLDALTAAAAREHHVTVDELTSTVRSARVCAARHAMWLRLRELGFSLPEIATLFEVDHATVLRGVRRATERAA